MYTLGVLKIRTFRNFYVEHAPRLIYSLSGAGKGTIPKNQKGSPHTLLMKRGSRSLLRSSLTYDGIGTRLGNFASLL
jgi:hypothetical protein